ncbi:TPA_asm: recombinase family protein, partial [Listeria monocytogenes]|nr:recombinase family protein [Listeria monocytogenes]
MQTARKKNISVIPSQPEYDRSIKVQFKMLRVAAYCRVSTTLEQQESSYEAQVSYYTEKIQSNPNWKLAGIYADDGKSATNTKKRDDFNTMIDDCMAGKIDLVITKSVSRFARNTVDSLQNIRKLKEKNIGVIFEKEGVNTLDGTGELLITILSSQAQEESRNLSENTRWGLVRRFENGVISVNHTKFLGYTKDENGELVIVPEEAELVRRIFRLYLEGNSSIKIAKILKADGIKTVTGMDTWQPSVIDQMLRNEKYMGDALLQKTYTVDFLSKKRVKNQGIVPQYYIEDNHEAIIPRELFYRAQEEKARRAAIYKPSIEKKSKTEKSKYSSKYSLSDIMICGECGQPYRRQTWSKYGQKSAVWR